MHGRVCERRHKSRRRHMLISSSRVIATVEGGGSSCLSLSSSTSFSKDGRKISVGDCALFKPPQDCPPFIGIIRLIIAEKEGKLKLGVNWLYRPTELKLGKGTLLEAEPNELFYSFHEDNIPAASLLHPCKVAFLPRGVELPSGICSFVCRRVYDVTNERLWWLTDQDYIDDRQLEVDKLLCKTRSEMHTTLQQGGRSPKSMNSPTTSQAKDGIQNNNSFLSQGKGRKRERMDHGSESVKRERSSRVDDSGSGPLRTESGLKSEISKFTEKGGLVDSEGVEKLLQLMLPERNEKKIDLIGRAILAGVVAATDKFDCLSRFVQLRGLPVFDEWLQEVHKGKVGDGGSPKDSDRLVDDFLLVLLRALDKLPVNLNALQTCNIGKSVNHLRSHKNSEIGKKARSLVDTWKKRVEAEMDAKSGSNQGVSWPGRLSHGGRHSGGSAEANKTSSSHLHASKSVSVKQQVENNLKCVATSPGSTRSAPSPGSGGTISKDGQQRNAGAGGVSEVLAAVKDEKSSSSSQSHNNSQSCSSEHAKTGNLCGKEDARSSTAGSTLKKCSGGSSRHRKSNNVFQGSSSSASPREAGFSRSFSSQRNVPSEKISQSSLTSEKTLEVPLTESSGNKLIVKLPNRGRSPAQSVSGGSLEDPAPVNSRVSSPVHAVKQELCDNNVREKNHSYRANVSSVLNAESWQSNELKDILTGSQEAAGSPLVVAGDERGGALKDSDKAAGNVKGTSSLGNDFKSGERHGGTLSSMNALIESCVRYSETNASLAGSDDVGINLLASVAADEMSKSPVASPSVSQPPNSLMNENSTVGNNTKLIASDGLPHEQHQAARTTVSNEQGEQHVSSSGTQLESEIKNESKTGDRDKSSNSETEDLQRLVDKRLENNDNSDGAVASPVLPTKAIKEKILDDSDSGEVKDIKADVKSEADCTSDSTKRVASSMLTECRDVSQKVDSVAVEHTPLDRVDDKKEEKPPTALSSELVKKVEEDVPVSSGISRGMDAVSIDRPITEMVNNMAVNHIDQKDIKKIKQDCDAFVGAIKDASAGLDSSVTKGKVEPVEGNLENIKVKERCLGLKATPGVSPKDAEDLKRPNGPKTSDADGDEAEECTSAARDASSVSAAASAGSEMDARVEFDLNEGFDGDDAKHGDSNNFSGSVFLTPTPLQPVNTLPFPVAPVSSGIPASITVAAAAKGPFVPPEDLLRNKGAVGWRGSAATSAFRPAEPRKAQDVLLSINNTSTSDASTSAGKQTRTFLDFDLNVPDERVLEDLASQRTGIATNCTSGITNSFDQVRSGVMGSALDHSSGGLDLDLNKVDDSTDMNNYNMSSSHRLDSSFQHVKLPSTGGRRDFDLNDGPAGDDAAVEPSMVLNQHSRSGLPSQPSLSGIRVNGENMASFSTWFPAANAYSAVSIPPIMPERGDQPFPMIANRGPQRMLGPTTGVSSFAPEGYRGPVLSSSPAMPFQSTTFQYPVFPFGNSFPITSANFSGASTTHMDSSSSGRACFPGVNSQILGPGVPVPSNYPRPYIVGLPNGGSNGGVLDNSAKWFRSGLDLNSGPGGHETEGRDESTLVARQLSSSASLPLKEDQARMYQMSGGVLKRKEPEGGWDGYRQSSWQ
ncbi:hypothetical protein ARALYDRAFT_485166 [Arabidopsis lyrata subsp. lyrata]|uniref:BAH domain-containing protein n=1 Tax=Arabidopsis lyrata subsp. lyrata TaxID=81972 RepID=D7LRI5_ARALL|nr:uncharacterized protein LOC9311945 isoform X2 [Arabidopsis lyrata subsp. lyrata]EFH53853.1 hypothetical protein ARALYDRAFT_485166 [Arabidopsis lyrata subsp. lyrata]|eukprot:XP_020880348.1 uncharacterized protein LOC9311945 isoform X2 [Arabidopsis lyrata subsp. lyrata]